MEIRSDYQNYMSIMKDIYAQKELPERKEQYGEAFETIYQKAQDSDIKLSSAKEFLKNLSTEEMTTLQKYEGLADTINIDSLSEEGAYNLLMHGYEKFDFNSDGAIEIGAALTSIPAEARMTEDVRDAFTKSMDGLGVEGALLVRFLTLDTAYLTSKINGTEYKPTTIDYTTMKNKVDSILNPTPPSYSSPEFQEVIGEFWDTFESNYTGDRTIVNQQTDSSENSEVDALMDELQEVGASAFLARLRERKIEEEVEKYRAKLLQQMGSTPEAMAKVEEMVNDFKESLVEKLKKELKEKTKMESANPLSMLLQSS